MPDFPTLPPIADQPISVILLATGEQPLIEEIVGHWVTVLEGLGRSAEILLIEDWPEDRCAALQTVLSAGSCNVKVLRDAERRGSGAALRLGIGNAQHPLLFYTTCDRQFCPADISLLLAEIDKVDLVTACRTVPRVPLIWRALGLCYRAVVRVIFGVPLDRMPGWLGWRGLVYRCFVRICFGVRVSNVDCPFRLFRRHVFARIPIQSDGDFAHAEMLAKANHLGYLMTEVAVINQPLPPSAPELAKSQATQRRREAYRVFAHPDFGPALLHSLENSVSSPPTAVGGSGCMQGP